MAEDEVDEVVSEMISLVISNTERRLPAPQVSMEFPPHGNEQSDSGAAIDPAEKVTPQ